MQRIYLEMTHPEIGDFIKSMRADGTDEQWFVTFPELSNYADAAGEDLIRLDSEDQFWLIVSGQSAVPESAMFGSDYTLPLIAGLGAVLLLRRRWNKSAR